MRVIVPCLCAALFVGCASMSAVRNDANADVLAARKESYTHFIRSQMLQREGHFEEALEEMRKAAETADDPLPILRRLIWGYYRLNDFEGALEMSIKSVEAAPEDGTLWTVTGRLYEQLGRYDEAADAFRKAVELSPEDDLQYEEVIEAELQGNDMVGAIEMYERLVIMHPENAQLQYRLGLALVRINDLKGAQPHLEKALVLDSSLDQAKYILGLVYLETNDFEAAERTLRALQDSESEFPRAQQYLAAALAQMGRPAEAADIFSNRIENGEADADEHVALMYLGWRLGRFDTGMGALPPTGAPIFGTFMRALLLKSSGEAFDTVLATLDMVEGNLDGEIRAYLSELSFLFGEEDLAQHLAPAMEDLCEQAPTSRVAAILHGRLLMNLKRYKDAEKVLRAVVETHGPDFMVETTLALIYDELDRFPEAEVHLKSCLTLRPDDHSTMNTLGYLYAEENIKLDEAEDLLERAINMDPGNPYYLDSIGWVHYRRGEAEKAIDYIRRSIIRMGSDDAVLRDHLGDAYLLNGEKDRAVAEWRRARRLDPELEGVEKKLNRYGK
jgi:tetratricopeptide (TPR) repeat protein